MLFTIITIVFLPLSFCTSIFGMNTAEFNSGLLTLHEELYYMFPISIAIIIVSFTFAFSSSTFISAFFSLVWESVSYPANVAVTLFLTRTGLYTLSRELGAKAKDVRGRNKKVTANLKADIVRGQMERKVARDLLKDDDEAGRGSGDPDGKRDDLESATGSGSSQATLYYSKTV